MVAVGSVSRTPALDGLSGVLTWTNHDATLTRDLPKSLLILGGGPTGCELAQVYARFEVPTTIIQAGPRLAPTDHPRNSDAIRAALEQDGVTVRTGVRALRAHADAGADGAHVIDLDDGSTAQGHVILLAAGRSLPIEDLGLEHYGIDTSGRTPFPRDGRLRIADGLWVIGDAAGPELHTPGPLSGRSRRAHGAGRAPRARLPSPAAGHLYGSGGGVRRTHARPGARRRSRRLRAGGQVRHDCARICRPSHDRPRLDRCEPGDPGARRRSDGLPDASAAIHECVLAIKAHISVDVLAETIHAFPSTSRIFNGLFADARRQLGAGRGASRPTIASTS